MAKLLLINDNKNLPLNNIDDVIAVYPDDVQLGTYNATTGLVYWDIIQGASVLFEISECGVRLTKLIPEESSARIYDMVKS